jgi:putative MATE family efflux protein
LDKKISVFDLILGKTFGNALKKPRKRLSFSLGFYNQALCCIMKTKDWKQRNMEYINPLGVAKISKLLVKFSVPAIVGMLVNALYNIVDRIYIGNSPSLGAYGIAGITIAFPIMIILLSIGLLFGVGGATLFSIRLGQKKYQEAEQTLGNAFSLLVLSGLLFMVLGEVFLTRILALFGASEQVLPYALSYMRYIFFGAVFQIVSIGMNHFIRADGNPRVAMLTMFMGAGINTLLDPLFIFGFNMGMEGAALATVIAQAISSIWVVSYFLGKRSRNKLHLVNLRPRKTVIATIVSLGLPSFLMQLANSLLNVVLNKSLVFYGGDMAISAMGIINSLQTILVMPVVGINQGAQPLISYNYGAKKYPRVKEAVKLAILAATVVVSVGYLCTRLFPRQLVSLFNRDPELLKFGSFALSRWLLLMPLVGFQMIGANFFQAVGRPRSAMLLTLSRQVLFLIPAILVFPRIWGLEGLLYAAPVADLLSTFLTAVWFSLGLKNLEHHKTANQLL